MNTQTTRQEQRMAEDFLRLQRGGTFDAIKAMNLMADVWGIKMDWHVFATVMSKMAQSGDAIIAEQRNGMTTYFIS